jgi:hypothetical protein
MSAVRALLTGVVDYAGLFPPAALDMPTAVRNYVAYRSEPSSWMLGRFVIPVSRLDELAGIVQHVDLGATPIGLSVLCGGTAAEDIETALAFQNAHGAEVTVDVAEARVAGVEEIESLAASAAGRLEIFAEVPSDPDPRELIAAAAHAGISAKIRTGGVTPDAFPSAANVVRFIRRCLDARVRFKATAGLHHPIRAEYALTYEASPPRGMMFGYLNVLLATAFMRQGMSDDDARLVLEEQDRSAFLIADGAISWRGRSLDTTNLQALRDQAAVSFGSCSFREPVDELQALGAMV